jgi:formylglycine-generating enzyme
VVTCFVRRLLIPLGSYHGCSRCPLQLAKDQPKVRPSITDMVQVPGGTFRMGSDKHYPEEAPEHQVTVLPFRIDATPVTNRQFRQFVEATGYATVAERQPHPPNSPRAAPHLLEAGSLVFIPPKRPVELRDLSQWWSFRTGANWRRPFGAQLGKAVDRHPVVHLAFEDAEAYASWAGKSLPTEAEWEFAARGGMDGSEYAWGDEFTPGGRHMANTWQGQFPQENLATDGYPRTSPVGVFPATWRPAHLLARSHPAMQQRVHCALRMRAPARRLEPGQYIGRSCKSGGQDRRPIRR